MNGFFRQPLSWLALAVIAVAFSNQLQQCELCEHRYRIAREGAQAMTLLTHAELAALEQRAVADPHMRQLIEHIHALGAVMAELEAQHKELRAILGPLPENVDLPSACRTWMAAYEGLRETVIEQGQQLWSRGGQRG